jgi:HEPN domain-containing protein
MEKIIQNWVSTSNYDIKTAEAMYKAGRYIYVVFMCHLAMEKMLKALVAKNQPEDMPPKIHNLIHLAQRADVSPPEELRDFFQRIDNVSIVTRYPEDLQQMKKEFDQNTTKRILTDTKRVVKWLKQHLHSID